MKVCSPQPKVVLLPQPEVIDSLFHVVTYQYNINARRDLAEASVSYELDSP
jgi:hypothetical protein